MRNKNKTAVCLFILGLIIIALRVDREIGVDYGYIIGENEGAAMYFLTRLAIIFTGENVLIDIFFDPVGYILIIAGLWIMNRDGKANRAMVAAGVAMGAYVIQMVLPFLVNQDNLFAPELALFLIQVVGILRILYGFASMCTKNIDNYKYMNVGKDLRFAGELYITCLIISRVLQVLGIFQFYMADILYIMVEILGIVVMLYYIYKAYKYHIFVNYSKEDK